jgi:hypothetical protein
MVCFTFPHNKEIMKDEQNKLNKESNWTRIKRKIRRFLIQFTLLIIVFAAIFIYWKYYYTYSNGYRAGLLQKFSHKGNLFKTYEGEMILSSISSNLNVALASEKFNFSVTNAKLAQKLDTMQGQRVIVHYMEKNGILFWRGESAYVVDSVKYIR